jgi:hypothetical protein
MDTKKFREELAIEFVGLGKQYSIMFVKDKRGNLFVREPKRILPLRKKKKL